MHKNVRTFLAAATAVFIAGVAPAQGTPFTYEDLLMLDRISDLSVTPDGSHALFIVRATDMDKNRGVRSLWLKDLEHPEKPEVRLAVSDEGVSSARWGPDGRTIYFLSARGEGSSVQLWRTDMKGSVAEQVTRLPLDIGAYRVTPDGKGVVVALAVYPNAKEDEIATTVSRIKERKMGSGTVYDRVFVRHWDSWKDGTRDHLFYVAMGTDAEPVALTPGFDGDVPSKPFGDEGDFCISPGSETVYFSAREAGATEPWSTNFDIYSAPITGGPATNLTATNKAWDASPRISPDGKMLAYKAMARPGFEADRFVIHVCEVATGRLITVISEWDRSVEQIEWSDDGRSLYVTVDDIGRHRLYQVDLEHGGFTARSRAGHIDAFAETPKGFVFLKSAMDSPSQLYAARPKTVMIEDGATNLTRVNAGLKNKDFGAYEQFSFSGWNNEQVYGYVVKPADYVEGRKYPVAFLIHGGPQGSFGDGWSYRWNPQTYAGAGFAVVMIDFHGSTGYGQAFCDAISGHWGDRPLEDLQKGWEHALREFPFLDADRAAALGASYGGFMVNWMAGKWKGPWKCLVSHDGVFDARSMGYSTEEMWFANWEQGGSAFSEPEKYDRFNPALWAKDWSVPMLIIHSDLDYRIPVEQGIGAFSALQEKQVPSQFLRFPDENHWVLKPRNSKQWHDTVFSWLNRYLAQGQRR